MSGQAEQASCFLRSHLAALRAHIDKLTSRCCLKPNLNQKKDDRLELQKLNNKFYNVAKQGFLGTVS